MSTFAPPLFRTFVRPVVAVSLLVLGLALLVPSPPANAAGKQFYGNVVVGPAGAQEDVSTVVGDVVVNGPVAGDVETGFGDVRVNAPVAGRVDADFGDVYVYSRVGDDVEVGHGDVYLGPESRVGGDVFLGSGKVHPEGNPFVAGNVSARMSALSGDHREGEGWGVAGFAGWFFGSLVFAAVAVLAAVFIPRQLTSSARKIDESPGRASLVGLASLPAAVVLSVVLAVSLVGIPLLLLAAPAYLALVFFGALVAAYFLGRRILVATGRYHAGNALAAGLGALLLSAAYLIPFLGGLLLYGFALVGTGAAIMAFFSRSHRTYPTYETYVRERRA